jgi:hypothetical protein
MKEKLKEIWSEWWNSTKESATKTWKAIRSLCSASFHLIKDPIIALFDGLYEWFKAIVVGGMDIIVAFVSVFLTSLGSSLCKTFYQFYVWVKEKVIKW